MFLDRKLKAWPKEEKKTALFQTERIILRICVSGKLRARRPATAVSVSEAVSGGKDREGRAVLSLTRDFVLKLRVRNGENVCVSVCARTRLSGS